MAKISNVEILFLLVVMALMPLPHTTEATEHVVPWMIPLADPSLYSSFAAKRTFRLHDTLLFNFTTGTHNVVTLSKKNFETCNVNTSNIMKSFESGPATITLDHTGEFYFACTFPNHCTLGQKLSVNVTENSSSSPSLAPSPSASRAAITVAVAVTVPVLFIALAINVLFHN